MSRGTGYLLLVFILLGFAVADYFVVTSSASVERMARGELSKIFGKDLQYDDLSASFFDGLLVVTRPELVQTPQNLKVFSAERAEIRFGGGASPRIREILLDRPRISLSDRLFDELERMPPGKPLHERLTPDQLPRVVCRGGVLDFSHRRFLPEDRPQVFVIETLALTPAHGYRYVLSGSLGNKVVGQWRIFGEYDLRSRDLRLRFECPRFRFGKEVKDALHPDLHRDWNRYSPVGPAALRVEYAEENGGKPDFRVTVAAQGLEITYGNFPYTVGGIHGEIELRSDGFTVKNFRGRQGPAKVWFDGVSGGYAAEADFRFRLKMEDVPLDARLRKALGNVGGAGKVWDEFGPSGRVDVEGWILREAGPDRPVRSPLQIRFKEARLFYQGFRYPLENVYGRIRVETPRVDVERLVSVTPRWHLTSIGFLPDLPTKIELHGWIDDVDSEPVLDLSISADRLPLDDNLKQALQGEMRERWEEFRPEESTIDLNWRVIKRKGEEPVHRGTARLRDCIARYEKLLVRKIEGVVRYEPGRIELRDIRGRCEGSEVSLQGLIDRKATRLELRSVGMNLAPEVIEKLPGEVRKLLRTLKLRGKVNVNVDLTVRKGEPKSIDAGVAIKIVNGTIDADLSMKELQGEAFLELYVRGEEVTMKGPLRFNRANIEGKEVRAVSCSLTKTGAILDFNEIQGKAYGGVVTGNLTVDTQKETFSGGFTVDRMELGLYSAGPKSLPTTDAPQGKIYLEIQDLRGKGGDSASIKGTGKLLITEGRLWKVPVFAGIFSLDPSKWSGKPVFSAGKVYFDIADRKFKIRSLGFEGEGTTLAGKGTVDFDGNLDLRLKMQSGSLFGIDFFLFRLPVQILDFLRNTMLPIRITGTFEKPKVNQ